MIEIQILSRVLNQNSLKLIQDNNLDESYFVKYEDEYKYIVQHTNEYGTVPDKATFLSKFPEFDIIEVAESDKYLIDTIQEEHLYSVSVPIINRVAELMQTNTNDAVDYLQSQLPKLMLQTGNTIGIDIIKEANLRYEEYKAMNDNPDNYFIETGFKELDELVGGWHKGEEFVCIFARTGQGKSWVLINILTHAWKMGNRVGLIEPEMSANKTGFRFDTLNEHFSNKALTRGENVDNYVDYVDNLTQNKIPFIVAHPKDFNRKITVSKLKSFCINNKLDILAVDGISYLTDERKERGDNITTQLTHISEDCMDLSIELGIPVIIIAQSNRGGLVTEEPELENIRDSDGIAYNSSIVISVAQKKEDNALILALKKNRNGINNAKLTYTWDIDVGSFTYIPAHNDGAVDSEEVSKNTRRKFKDEEERF